MSKHLPSNMLHAPTNKSSTPPLSHHPTDFSTDALLKQQQQRSTIQWIGAHHHLNHLNHQQLQLQAAAGGQTGGTAPLPASALLRQLYANRESVIRANVHGITTSSTTAAAAAAAAAVAQRASASSASSAAHYYTGELSQVGPLPTPPGSEGSSTYSEHQFMLQHQKATNGDSFGSLGSLYPGSGGYAMEYHNAMTPPSSVSPRDKQQSAPGVPGGGGASATSAAVHGGVSFDNTVPMYSDVLRHQYGVVASESGPTQPLPLPLKPQVYSAMHPSALDAYVSSAPLDQSQFYHHGATGAGFHLYHPANKGGPANSANWYSAS